MSAGASKGSGDTRFERSGDVLTTSFRALTPQQTGGFDKALNATQPGVSSSLVDGSLATRLGLNLQSTPYQPELCRVIRSSMPEVAQPGQASLQAQSQVNPYSGTYEENTFNRFQDEMQRAMSMARSGPNMTRGGTAAQGFAQAEVANEMGRGREDILQKNRQVDSAISNQAAQSLSQGRAQMNQTALGGMQSQFGNFHNLEQDKQSAAALASERDKQYGDLLSQFTQLAAKTNNTEHNALTGHGAQTNSSMGASLSLCCFIFLEAYYGTLPDVVRRYRDEKAPERSKCRTGYIRMSRWLVPAMRVSRVVRWLVGLSMTKPLTSYGKWYYGEGRVGVVFAPVERFWMKVWEKIG